MYSSIRKNPPTLLVLSNSTESGGAFVRFLKETQQYVQISHIQTDCRSDEACKAAYNAVRDVNPSCVLVRALPLIDSITLPKHERFMLLCKKLERSITFLDSLNACDMEYHKSKMYAHFSQISVPIPYLTVIAHDEQEHEANTKIDTLLTRYGIDGLILKPSIGASGHGIETTQSLAHIKSYIQKYQSQGRDIIIQQKIETHKTGASSIRVVCINDEVILAVRTTNEEKITSNAGHILKEIEITPQIRELAKQIARHSNIGFSGIDFLEGLDGKLWFNEINSSPSWRLLERCVTDLSHLRERLIDAMVSAGQCSLDKKLCASVTYRQPPTSPHPAL